MEKQNLNICILGLGRVGKQLASVFHRLEIPVLAAYNRSPVSEEIPGLDSKNIYQDINLLPQQADIYIISVSDDAVKGLADTLPKKIKQEKIVAHTSGIHTLDIFSEDIRFPGVFYPLNTFSDTREVSWDKTPFYISGAKGVARKLQLLANEISDKVFTISDEQKKILHLAAVLVNNFPTHLFHQADQLLKDNDLEFAHLLPLIQTMVDNLKHQSPGQIQTGPAVRGDRHTIRQHLELLKNDKELKEIYALLSKSINNDLEI